MKNPKSEIPALPAGRRNPKQILNSNFQNIFCFAHLNFGNSGLFRASIFDIRIYRKAFTYIELLITLAIIGVLFVPVMQLFSHSLYSAGTSQDLITAVNLAKWEMERVKNLSLTKQQLREAGDSIYPGAGQEPLEMNNMKWRIARKIISKSDPLQIQVSVYRDGYPREPLITLVTLIEDMTWKEIISVK